MSDYADPDYEPTLDELHEWIACFSDWEPGHGSVNLIPTLADRIWEVPGVWWSGRRVLANGWVQFQWMIPESLPHP